jgi:Spy/CpxP family protein refolding chaperone
MPKNVKAIAGILLVFVLGAVSGSLITHMVLQARFEAFMHGGPGVREEQIVKRLSRELSLDSGQQEQIRGIVHETHAAIREMRGQMRPRVEALLDQGQTRISAVLRPEQRDKFTKLMAERKSHRLRERPSQERP